MILIVGGASELGAMLAKILLTQETSNIVIVDKIDDHNWHHLKDTVLTDLVDLEELPTFLENQKKNIKTVINLPPSALPPTASIKDYLKTNFRFPFDLYHWSCRHRVRLLQVVCSTADDNPAYQWSNQLLATALNQINIIKEREYPAPPQFARVTVGRLFGKEIKYSKDDLIRYTLNSNTTQHLTPLNNCVRLLLWLLNNPSVSTEINLVEEASASSIQSLLANKKEIIIKSSPSTVDLSHVGFNEPLISIEEGLNLLLQQNESQHT